MKAERRDPQLDERHSVQEQEDAAHAGQIRVEQFGEKVLSLLGEAVDVEPAAPPVDDVRDAR